MGAEIEALEARRAPAARRARASAARPPSAPSANAQHAADVLAQEEEAYALANRTIEGLESDVEAARSEVYAAVNAATALRHAMEHAAAARARIGEQLGKLDVERNDLAGRGAARRRGARRRRRRAAPRRARRWRSLHVDRAARDSELSVARSSREALGRDVRTREHELAGVVARLKSLEELDAARAEYGDGARMILAESGDAVPHLGSVADYVEVDQRVRARRRRRPRRSAPARRRAHARRRRRGPGVRRASAPPAASASSSSARRTAEHSAPSTEHRH